MTEERNVNEYLITEIDWDNPESLICFDEPLVDPGYYMWQERRETSIKCCGCLYMKESATNGIGGIHQHFCGDPDCPHCGPKIREEMRLALEDKLKEKSFRLVKLTGDDKTLKKERAKLVRKYGGKDKVSVFCNEVMTENGLQNTLEILIDTDDEIGEEYNQIQTEDIAKWSQKTFTFKKSGNLHKSKDVGLAGSNEDNDEEPSEPIQCQKWIVDTNDEKLLRSIEIEVVKKTPHLNPKIFNELHNAMIERRRIRKELYEQNNIVILSLDSTYTTVKMSQVNWQKYNEAALRL